MAAIAAPVQVFQRSLVSSPRPLASLGNGLGTLLLVLLLVGLISAVVSIAVLVYGFIVAQRAGRGSKRALTVWIAIVVIEGASWLAVVVPWAFGGGGYSGGVIMLPVVIAGQAALFVAARRGTRYDQPSRATFEPSFTSHPKDPVDLEIDDLERQMTTLQRASFGSDTGPRRGVLRGPASQPNRSGAGAGLSAPTTMANRAKTRSHGAAAAADNPPSARYVPDTRSTEAPLDADIAAFLRRMKAEPPDSSASS